MDIQQLRSWIFELYEPLENQRTYIVYDADRGNLLIDVPPFSERALRLIRGTGRSSLLLITNAARAADAHRYREALGVQVAAHEDDAAGVEGGPDLVLEDREQVRPDTVAVRARSQDGGATVVLVRKFGGVLVSGDLDLASEAARELLTLEFSAVLSSGRPPVWNAGRDDLLEQQRVLPRPPKRFGILLQPPWDRSYAGRLQDQMVANPLVPADATVGREAAMGGSTLVVARLTPQRMEQAPRPVPADRPAASSETVPEAATARRNRPRSFAEDWQAPSSPRPPTTLANPLADIQPREAAHRPRPVGARFRRFEVEELGALPNVDYIWGGIHLSPDGSEVAFAWNRGGTFEIYTAPLEGDRIIQLTQGGEKDRSVWPRWSPDGRWVAFLRDRGGDEAFDIWLVDRDGERERFLVGREGVMHREIAWSPDGGKLAFAANYEGPFGIHVADVGTGERRAVTDGRHDDFMPRWSPDGSEILFWSRRDAVRTNTDLYVVSAGGGDARRLAVRGGVDGEALDGQWSPDGTTIAFTTNVRGRYEIALASYRDGSVGGVQHLGATPFDDTAPRWRPDGRGIVYTRSEEDMLSLRRVFTISRADDPIADVPGTHFWQQVGPDSETVSFVFSGARNPADVHVRTPESIQSRPITSSLGSKIDPAALVEPAHVRYPGADGRAIPALLYVPHAEALRGEGPPPGVLYVHGGPTGQHYRWWDPVAQLLANRGFVVLAPNIRGSTGYGREFQEANRRDWGGKDLQDVVRGAEWLAGEGIADGRRLGIYGGSYGGYMTLMCLAMAPGRWAAGVSLVGVVSLRTLFDSTRGDLREYLLRELGDPAEEAAFYRDRSPLTHAARIAAPLLVLQGQNDPRVPPSEAEQLVAALKGARKTHEYHVYPDEGHGFRRTDNRVDALRRTLAWFERHLQPD
ncbi:MAG: prolyl oligopeptidase family serine peptidase [Candidatus Limnocylindria bacterium]